MTGQPTFGLIGARIAYSRSPDIFAAIFAADGVRGSFSVFDIVEADFETEMARIIGSGLGGLAVTIPYKERVIGMLDRIDRTATVVQAVNSVAIGNSLEGFNTDVHGFELALRPYRSIVAGRPALILGTGGAARAAMWALYGSFEIQYFDVVSRSLAMPAALGRTAQEMGASEVIIRRPHEAPARGTDYGVVVNATPLGGWNFPDQSPLPAGFRWEQAGVYYDLNYNERNAVLAQAATAGVTVLEGSRMLVGQAVESYRLWTGRTVDIGRVYETVFRRRFESGV